MATVVNARDVLLQATVPRVANVAMASNLVVDQAQVSGLGVVLDGTKLVFLQATSQVFQIAKTGAISPTFTTLTALVKNITGAPVLTVTSGTITPAPTLVGGVVTIQQTALITDTATIRLSVTDSGSGATYTDELTIVRVREGSDGVTGFLTNENHTVPADQLGNVLSYANCGGTFQMYQGTNDITALCTYAIQANPSALTVALNAATGVYAVSGGYPTGTDTTTVTFRATFGTAVFDKVFTVTKSKNGTVGANGQRGSRTWYVALTGATNTYSDTLAATTATQDGGPVLNDTVTQYNNSVNFSQTKFWNGTAWVIVNAVVDGNLLVSGTVGTSQLAANAVTATKINVATLTAIQASLGTAQIDANGYLRSAGATAYNVGTGFWLGYDTTDTKYKFRIGNPAGNNLTWDGATLTMTGALNAATGTFNGNISGASGTFTGGLNAGSAGKFVVDGAGNVTIKNAAGGARLEISNSTIRVYDASGALRVKLGDLA